jgi:endonuclease VIII-like 1
LKHLVSKLQFPLGQNRFLTKDSEIPIQVLNFVDFRRFGRWEMNADWGSDRGPCPITDYETFRKNIVDNLEDPAFKQKAICEVLLNQKFFNGIGNYLRAEILFRWVGLLGTFCVNL